ncbi:MAG: UDP-glucose 4-epimerase GalE [Desulfobacterales bacterium]|jgi:UDP-glucose-4-epimerase GalE|nr:UDP-glucose 4-epimerase GalE [Desulfobacterales bacterium]
MNVLVTGGAGYIGSHCCKELAAQGFRPVVFDDLSKGHRENLRWGEFYQGTTGSRQDLAECLDRHRIEAVMHFAAFIEVGESVADPAAYYRNNVCGSLNLLQAMVQRGIRRLVFSSSAAVYGNPARVPIDEEHARAPLSPYGWSKQMVETLLADFDVAWGLRAVALRYFNAAGADASAEIGEQHTPESHLIPRLLDAAMAGSPVEIYGTDYATPDGTCIRDYIHVTDLARAHVAALEHLLNGRPSGAFNLGQGRGFSVREVIHKTMEITGRPIQVRTAARRPGDAPMLIASNEKARRELGWTPRHSDLENILATAWQWHQRIRR